MATYNVCSNKHCVWCIYYLELGAIINKPKVEFVGYCNVDNCSGNKERSLHLVSAIGNACDKFMCRICLEKENNDDS